MNVRVTLPKIPRIIWLVSVFAVAVNGWLLYENGSAMLYGDNRLLSACLVIINGACLIYLLRGMVGAWREDRRIRFHERRLGRELEKVLRDIMDEIEKNQEATDEPA